MDIDSSAGPTRIATELAATGVAPPEVIIRPAASGLPASSAAPEDPAEKAAERTSTIPATAQGDGPASSASIPVGTPVEGAIIGGLKESLVKATQFDLRLRELASEAELVKSNRSEEHTSELQSRLH